MTCQGAWCRRRTLAIWGSSSASCCATTRPRSTWTPCKGDFSNWRTCEMLWLFKVMAHSIRFVALFSWKFTQVYVTDLTLMLKMILFFVIGSILPIYTHFGKMFTKKTMIMLLNSQYFVYSNQLHFFNVCLHSLQCTKSAMKNANCSKVLSFLYTHSSSQG